jgi:hypothetical protein
MSKKVRFIAGCPVKGCINGNIPIYWCHNQDDGAMYIFDNGYLECDDCETNGLIIDWKFDCGEHDYEYASYQGYLNMIAVLGHLVADEDFIDDCIDAGKRQRRRFRGK